MSYSKLNPIIKKFIFVVFLYGLTSASFNGFFGIYIKELGYDESVVGGILSLRRFSVGILAFLFAIYSNKIGHKRSLLFGLFVVSVTSFLIVLTENLSIIYVLSVVFGLGQAAMMTIESPFIFDQTDSEERVHAFSLAFATRNAAFMTGSLLTGFLADFLSQYFISDVESIRYALIIISALSLLALFPLLSLKPRPVVQKDILSIKELKGFFTKINVLFLMYTGLIGLGAGLVVPFFGMYLKYMLETTEGIVGTILAIAQLGTVVGGLSVPYLSNKYGKFKTIIATQLLSIPLLIMIGLPQGLIIVTIAFFLRSSLMNMSQPLIRNISMQIVDDSTKLLMSAMRAMVNNLTRALGILVGGFLMTHYSYNLPYAFTILFYIIGTLLFYIVFRREVKTENVEI